MANHMTGHPHDDQQRELMQLLQSEIESIHSLMRSLEQENAALAEHHTAALEDVIWGKQEIIQKLEVIDQQRESLLTAMGVSAAMSKDGDISDTFKGNKRLLALWDELVSLAEKCQKKNRINGSIVDLVSRQSRHALDILRGITPGDELYDYSGQTRQFTQSHSLTKA